MRQRSILLLASALVLGLASVVLAHQWLTRAPAAAPTPALTVVVAREPLPAGTRLERRHLAETPWPPLAVPLGSFPTIDAVLGDPGRAVVLHALAAGEPVLAAKLGAALRATLSAQISGRHRAVTIRVNDVLGVAGFVLPGDRVDVLLTRDLGRDNPVTDVLLQRIKVLGIDQEASERKDKPMVARAVTLEVTPEEAQKITLATDVGTIGLALRSVADGTEVKPRTVGLADLAPPRAATRGEDSVAVRVLRGTEAATSRVARDR
ncbi:Flp pilus assembly protein CpaB [Magnetospirillum sp. UT-4]|uniref:Flp pilus assembly protein CpaB n=1 Tax=Magnetospirillum sp. UT-4 TaxID=2681467 RepID=UPI00138319B9|nr:Flp pilus assembly protein CpaB [Magnetospirillum sp. UT-4]CAA7615395.1 Flp pilus assembly protein RcpC/CpaB [Magnetospirillum sp. UT-4]